MLELLIAGAAIVAMVRIASAENMSSVIWGGITFGFCAACLFLPWPLVRMGIAFALAFATMTGYKIYASR
jgi:hypothetical protein